MQMNLAARSRSPRRAWSSHGSSRASTCRPP